MSTVLYAYKVHKSDFWNVFDDIREYYKSNYIILGALKAAKNEGYFDTMKMLKSFFAEETINRQDTRLQLFDFEDCWIFRVLEPGYYFMNNSHEFNIELIQYDNRTDVPPEDKPNELIADQIDMMIDSGHYFLVPLIDYGYVSGLCWKQAFENRENKND